MASGLGSAAPNTSKPISEGSLEHHAGRISNAAQEAHRLADELQVLGDRIFGSQPKPVSDSKASARPPFAMGLLDDAHEYLHAGLARIGAELDRLQRL